MYIMHHEKGFSDFIKAFISLKPCTFGIIRYSKSVTKGKFIQIFCNSTLYLHKVLDSLNKTETSIILIENFKYEHYFCS